ncbi:invasion associated locus B family protein [Pseudemcibacter aquimaris]|uniref:invasion associated locus B family protein n=1 Tax=Pseudemcibacter aquimaris TaxID=2857064 RepID=UPI002013B269|nr:invasion associated locus B family protein [Pseudemcibacter aquimaris]MCC3862471.1 invasion associated locus B family protein [Pseudemcibacter aquimaris]WDU59101.1 invasion associated locus B family protein [Pseudemcibacter aquimaris]
MKIFLPVIVASAMFTTFAHAQDTDATSENNVRWVINCPNVQPNQPPRCFATQTMRSDENQHLFLSMTVNKASNDTPATLQVTVPLGIQLAGGLTLQAGENNPVKIGYRTCLANGCMATANIADDMLATMQSVPEMKFNYTLLNQNTANVALNMRGFRQAYSTMIQRQNELRQARLENQEMNNE